MPKLRNVLNFITDPHARLAILSSRGFLSWMSDEQYLKYAYRIRMGSPLNLAPPRTYNEKLQWLKLHDRNPLYTQLVDKYAVRQYIAETIGEEYLIPLVGGPWKTFDEIDFDALPDQFVLKCTHDSGGLVICRDKSKLDKKAARRKITKSLRRNYYHSNREWPYKDVPPRIIAEQYMEDENDASGLTDYKFFCFNGDPRMLYVSRGLEEHSTAQISFYDLNGQEMPFHRQDFRPIEGALQLPGNFADMKGIAQRLAQAVNCSFVRIDLYSIHGRVYFSEVTFFPCSGQIPFQPIEWDATLGSWLHLPTQDT